jgi:3-methyladenine DNA glycosylase AlkD
MDAKEAAVAAREVLKDYDPAAVTVTADALREIWLGSAPQVPELQPGEKRLIRDWGIKDPQFEAVGVPVPVLTAIGNEVGKQGRKRVTGYLPLARLLWEQYGREGRIVSVVALGPMELADPESVVTAIYEMAKTCMFWEDCDQLAMKAWEPVLRREPDAWLESFGVWVRDDNKWVRRAAITAIGRLPMQQAEYATYCVELVTPALGDPDTDVKRALSFALRLCARGDVEPVKQFILDHRDVTDADSLWVLCDIVRSLWKVLLPEFVGLLPVYHSWLEKGNPKARRSVEGAIRILETVQ